MEIKKCTNCGLNTGNDKFCSRSCSAIYNNRIKPKGRRVPLTNKCRKCQAAIYKRNRWCPECHFKYREQLSNMSLRDVIITKGHRSWAHAKVRGRARTIAKNHGWDKCVCCNYSKCVDICHIKPVSSFDLDTKISVVNAKENLVPLCPNCHWEFDHSLMSEENKKKIFEFTSLKQELPLNSD